MAFPSFCVLPPEILLIIFHDTCDDDGTTARSLASVSRTFRWLALPLVYRVVAVHSLGRVSSLIECFEHEPGCASLVEHIFVADQRLVLDCLAFENVLHTLWRHVGSTVQTLALHVNSRDEDVSKVFQTVFDASFPRLTDLTLCGEHPIPTSPLAFPALQRFHSAGLTRRNAASCFAPLTLSCPELSHIRVSMATERNITFAVATAFGLPGARTDTERMCLDPVPLPENERREEAETHIPFPTLPRGLVSMVVKPAAPPMALFPGGTSMFYNQYFKQLEDLVLACPPGKAFLLPAFKRALWDVESYNITEAKRDWVEVIRGRPGAWTRVPA